MFLKDLKASFLAHKEAPVHFFKIPDMPHFKGSGTKFDIKKPYDALVTYRGVSIAIEAKFIKEYKSFGIKDLRPNQVDGLEDHERSGGLSFVFLNVRRPRSYTSELPPCNELIIFPWSEMRLKEGNYLKKELTALPSTPLKRGAYVGVERFLTGVHNYARFSNLQSHPFAVDTPKLKALIY